MSELSNQQKIEILILKLLDEMQEVNIRTIAKAAGFQKDDEAKRKVITRAMRSLTKRNLIIAKGGGRGRVYIKSEADFQTQKIGFNPFQSIELSPQAQALLIDVSQAIQARKPAGYNQNFLRLYKPNKTFYLTIEERKRLHSLGRVDTQIQPAGTYARNIINRLLIELSWNSSRLEGNTYSLLETKRLIELGEMATGKAATDAQMILNHKAAIEYVVDASNVASITSHEVCSIHALLSENLLGDPSASGKVREATVGISGTTYMPLENPHSLKECFKIFIEKFNRIKDPFEQSLFALIQLSYMQAFEDVNKRTARLVANIPLIKANLRPLSFTDVAPEAYVKALLGVYEKNDVSLIRDLYIWAYTRSSQRYSAVQQAMGEPNLFKLKYRTIIQEIVRAVILEKVNGSQVIHKIQKLIQLQNLSEADEAELLKVIETEILSLHEGNIARFKIRPSEFQVWKNLYST